MSEPKLRVMARGDAQVMHHYADHPRHGGAPHRRITHHHEPMLGPRFVDDQGQERRHGAFLKRLGEAIELPQAQMVLRPSQHGWVQVWEDHTATYLRDIRDGDLYPADDETAAAVGLPFSLKGKALDEALDANSIPHRWRDLALKAQAAKTSVLEQVSKARDEEHSADAKAEHADAVAELRAKYATSEVQKPSPGIV